MVSRCPADQVVLRDSYRICIENGSWDTSKALVRRTLERCIQLGRQARSSNNKADTYEAYRLLGQAVCVPSLPYGGVR